MTLRIKGSSGRYPAPRWEMTLRVMRYRRGGQFFTFEQRYGTKAKTKATAITRVIHTWARLHPRRLSAGDALLITNVRRAR